VADVDQTLARVEKLGGSRVTDPVPFALKDAARVALYGAPDDDTMKTSAFRDPAGNVFGIYHR
jgi:predicted enzyme related to lactoylglutathione lyase